MVVRSAAFDMVTMGDGIITGALTLVTCHLPSIQALSHHHMQIEPVEYKGDELEIGAIEIGAQLPCVPDASWCSPAGDMCVYVCTTVRIHVPHGAQPQAT